MDAIVLYPFRILGLVRSSAILRRTRRNPQKPQMRSALSHVRGVTTGNELPYYEPVFLL